MGFTRVGSNPTAVVTIVYTFYYKKKKKKEEREMNQSHTHTPFSVSHFKVMVAPVCAPHFV